ncbi:hypothetical protein AAVH_28063 [Aphelenchoides avenae]|nr:hypothetical protein AAVH_28063 [Aphelenchus avenae]
MTSGRTVKTSVLRSFKEDTDVNFDAKVVSISGPFTVRKKDGGDFLKLEVVLENCEREAFKLNAFGPHLSFQLQRLLRVNALVHFESLRVTAARYVSYRIGTLQVEFKYTASSKIHVLQDQFELPELPMASVESMKATNNVRKRIRITTEQMVASQDNMAVMGNVVMKDAGSSETLRMYCIIKSIVVEEREKLSNAEFVVTCTVRLDTDAVPSIRVECWHDIDFRDATQDSDVLVVTFAEASKTAPRNAVVQRQDVSASVDKNTRCKPEPHVFASIEAIEDPLGFGTVKHRVKCSLTSPFESDGQGHLGRIFIQDNDDYLSANLCVNLAPKKLEELPADTEIVFSGIVNQDEDGLVFTVSYADFEEPGDNGKNNTSHEVFPEYEAAQVERITDATLCFIVVKLAKRFEPIVEGYSGFATMVDKRSLALKVHLLGSDLQWPVELPVNSVIRIGGSVEKNNRRYSVVVGSPEDITVLEEGCDRKSLGVGVSNVSARNGVNPRPSNEMVDPQADGARDNKCEEQENRPDDSDCKKVVGTTSSTSVLNCVVNKENMRGSPASSEAVISDNLTADEEAAINIMNELGEAPEQDHDDSSDDVFEQEGVEKARTTIKPRRAMKRENNSLLGFSEAMKKGGGLVDNKRKRNTE